MTVGLSRLRIAEQVAQCRSQIHGAARGGKLLVFSDARTGKNSQRKHTAVLAAGRRDLLGMNGHGSITCGQTENHVTAIFAAESEKSRFFFAYSKRQI